MSLNQVKELRERTGCGMLDCKEALDEAQGDIEQAIALLRKKGKSSAAKKAERDTKEGVVATYVHGNGKIAVLVSLLCETDFVARNEKFQALATDIAMHIAATDPLVLQPEDISDEMVAEEEAIAKEQAAAQGKPAEIQEKIIAGKIKSFREERALLTQPFVKEPKKTIADLLSDAVNELGENITIGEFKRISI